MFRNHFPSRRRAYFRLPRQLSQLCAQSVHIFAYYPRMEAPRGPPIYTPGSRSGLASRVALGASRIGDRAPRARGVWCTPGCCGRAMGRRERDDTELCGTSRPTRNNYRKNQSSSLSPKENIHGFNYAVFYKQEHPHCGPSTGLHLCRPAIRIPTLQGQDCQSAVNCLSNV